MDDLATAASRLDIDPQRARVVAVVSDGLDTVDIAIPDPPPHALTHVVALDRVVDLDGDGRTEAVLLDYTGGVHCCFTYRVLSSEPTGITETDAFSLGSGAIQRVTDLDGDGLAELVGGDDRLALVADLPMATTP